MKLNFLQSINESANEEAAHLALLEQTITDVFGDQAIASVADHKVMWTAAKDSTTTISEASTASMSRAGERDWIQDATARQDEKKALKDKALGIKPKTDHMPSKGDMVALASGIGKIVDTDEKTKQVIIQDKAGNEKVFPMAQLVGPKTVQGKQAWALRN